MNYLLRISLTLGSLCAALPAQLTFSVDFSAQALTDLTSEEQALFTDGLAFWDRIIDGHQDNTDRNWTLFVDTFSQGSMNGGITLGSARPIDLLLTNPVPGSGLSAPWPDRFVIAGNGEASFNTNPEAGPLRSSVIIHEIGHALGIGTLWELNEVYNDGNPDTSSGRTLQGGIPGQYVGAHALAAYQAEFDPGATFIPVELDGGDGTAHGHWNEVTDNFSMENQPGFDSFPSHPAPSSASLASSVSPAAVAKKTAKKTDQKKSPSCLCRRGISNLNQRSFFKPHPRPNSGNHGSKHQSQHQ